MEEGARAALVFYGVYFCIIFGPTCLGCLLIIPAIRYSEKAKKQNAEEKRKKRLEESANIEMIDQSGQ